MTADGALSGKVAVVTGAGRSPIAAIRESPPSALPYYPGCSAQPPHNQGGGYT